MARATSLRSVMGLGLRRKMYLLNMPERHSCSDGSTSLAFTCYWGNKDGGVRTLGGMRFSHDVGNGDHFCNVSPKIFSSITLELATCSTWSSFRSSEARLQEPLDDWGKDLIGERAKLDSGRPSRSLRRNSVTSTALTRIISSYAAVLEPVQTANLISDSQRAAATCEPHPKCKTRSRAKTRLNNRLLQTRSLLQ